MSVMASMSPAATRCAQARSTRRANAAYSSFSVTRRRRPDVKARLTAGRRITPGGVLPSGAVRSARHGRLRAACERAGYGRANGVLVRILKKRKSAAPGQMPGAALGMCLAAVLAAGRGGDGGQNVGDVARVGDEDGLSLSDQLVASG